MKYLTKLNVSQNVILRKKIHLFLIVLLIVGSLTVFGCKITPDDCTVTGCEAGYVCNADTGECIEEIPENVGPSVDAGEDFTVLVDTPINLQGDVTDDGLPQGETLQTTWVVAQGDDSYVTFSDSNNPQTEVTFSEIGMYILRLIADDGELTGEDELVVTVEYGDPETIFDVNVWIDAEEGNLVSPIRISENGEYIYTPTGNHTNYAGYASFIFNVNEIGTYEILVDVHAPDEDHNSFFVGFDESVQGQDDFVWDVRVTQNFEEQIVTTKNGKNEWDLTIGQNTLFIFGREANTKIDGLKLSKKSVCNTGSWQDDACGVGNCNDDKMRQTRTVSPAGCAQSEQCVSNSNCETPQEKGFIKIDLRNPHSFVFENGERYFPMGDTMYYLLSQPDNLIEKYIDSRAEKGYNFIRVSAVDGDFWPFGGTPENPDFETIYESKIQKIDDLFEYAESKNMNIELIMWGYGLEGANGMWGDSEQEEAWVRYLANRYKDRKNLFMWTIVNEFERYPSPTAYTHEFPLENNWAADMAQIVQEEDANHLVSVHSGAGLFEEYKIQGTNLVRLITWPYWEGKSSIDFYNIFSRDGHMDGEWKWRDGGCFTGHAGVMLYNTTYEGKLYEADWTGKSWKYVAPGIEDGLAEDYSKGKPIVNTEMGYQYEEGVNENVHGVKTCQLYDSLVTRSNAWKTVTSGGFFATGFATTANIVDVALTSSAIDNWSPNPFKYLYDFMTTEVEYWNMAPHHELIDAHNSLLADIGEEYLAYFPFGNDGVNTRLNLQAGTYTVEWLNPRTGDYVQQGTITVSSGNRNFTPPSETSSDWVLHLKKV